MAQAGPSSLPAPSDSNVEEYTRLYKAYLAQASATTGLESGIPVDTQDDAPHVDATAALEAFRASIPAAQQPHLDCIARTLRGQFHAEQARRRRERLQGLLVQMPPFRLSVQDLRTRTTARARLQRRSEMRAFCKAYARRDNVGVHPFFAALRQVLAAQALDTQGRRLQWALDDAVLMECGGDDFMQAAVRMLKGVLHFDEHEKMHSDPFLADDERIKASHVTTAQDDKMLRVWTVASHLGNPECRDLAHVIPSHVVSSRSGSARRRASTSGSSSKPTRQGALVTPQDLAQLYSTSVDEELQDEQGCLLATGSLHVAPQQMRSVPSQADVYQSDDAGRRDLGFKGGWVEWLMGCLSSLVRGH